MESLGMASRKPPEDHPEFFLDLPQPPTDAEAKARTFKKFKKSLEPIWTRNKANLIQRYIIAFTQVTKHGTYIDLFAGPQRPDEQELWAAKLVLEARPAWIRNFHLFEIESAKVRALRELPGSLPIVNKRRIKIYEGDCNANVRKVLTDNPIKSTEATFCLLDQHTFQCDWDTVRFLAEHKKSGNKVELFYFLAVGWMDRSKSVRNDDDERLRLWWGDSNWNQIFAMGRSARGEFLANRFRQELGYKFAYSFPIYSLEEGGQCLYQMIHASDHPDAIPIMFAAYRNAIPRCDGLQAQFQGAGFRGSPR